MNLKNKLDVIKIKNFFVKVNVKTMTNHPGRKYLQNTQQIKYLCPKYPNHLKFNKKKPKNLIKIGRKIEQTFLQRRYANRK